VVSKKKVQSGRIEAEITLKRKLIIFLITRGHGAIVIARSFDRFNPVLSREREIKGQNF
jgi:hypothetical protein